MLRPPVSEHENSALTGLQADFLLGFPPANSSPSHVEIGLYDDDPPDTEAILGRFNFEYILKKVYQLVKLPNGLVHPAILDLVLEDIAQDVSINFWRCVVQRKSIRSYDAYIARMIHNRRFDEIRARTRPGRPQMVAIIDDEGMIEDNSLVLPADEVERGILVIQLIHQIAAAVAKLPTRQQLAITCSLLEKADNLPLMKEVLRLHGVNTSVQWPEDKERKRVLQASLPPARQAIAKRLGINIDNFMKSKRRSR